MRIMLVATSPENFSGASKCLIDIAGELIKRGNKVLVLLPRNGAIEKNLQKEDINYIAIHEYESWLSWGRFHHIKQLLNHFITVPKVKKILREYKIEVVHINAVTGGSSAAVAANKIGIPVVWHLRESLEQGLGVSFFNEKKSIRLISQSAKIIAISDFISKVWEKRLNRKIKVVYDGIRTDDYIVKKHYYHVNNPSILILGRIVPKKGQLELAQGIQRIEPTLRPKVRMAGKIEDPDYYKEIVSFVKRNNLVDFKYIGELENVREKLANTDIVCVCSDAEGLGRVTIESMLAGCLVIGANTGATPELIHNGINGFLYNKGNYVELSKTIRYSTSNIQNSIEIARFAQKEAIGKFSLENNITQLINIYKDVHNK